MWHAACLPDRLPDRYALTLFLRSICLTKLDVLDTKLDVLDTLATIKIGVRYVCKGQTLDSIPAAQCDLEACEVEYIEVPGWQTNIEVRVYL